jgi:hypothetical protein
VQYLGIDVHSIASVWCLLDEDGEIRARGKVETTVPALGELVAKLSEQGELRVGQEVGTMAYLVHDAVAGAGVEILSFNAHQLRMIASSRKKTDRRDAYWIARALQTGMYPHPVYLPMGEIRELRALLTRRRMVQTDRNRWQYRARCALRASGVQVRTGAHSLRKVLDQLLTSPQGIDGYLNDLLELCQRQEAALSLELRQAEAELRERAQAVEAIGRLQAPGFDHEDGLEGAPIHAGPGGARADEPLPERRGEALAGDRGAGAHVAGSAEDRDGGSRPAHPAHRVLPAARQHDLRARAAADCAQRRGQSGLNLHRSASKAAAEGVTGDQAAFCLGSFRGSRCIDWSVPSPARQRVPSRPGELEHEWKDGSSWRVAADVVARIISKSIRGGIAAEGRRVPGPYVGGLTAIMEGRGNSREISARSDKYDYVKLEPMRE